MTRGGKRIGAGRPIGSNKYGEATKVVRLPISRIEEVKVYLENSVGLPLYRSKIRAGFPSPAEDDIETHLDLNTHIVKHPGSTFFLTASGDSMIGAGINSGDLLVVDRSIEPVHGKIVIAAINGELTVKRLSKTSHGLLLLPDNDAYPAIEIKDSEDLIIWGVVTFVVHQAV